MLVSDNQQVTIGWFVGILEGEGSFENYQNRQYIGVHNSDSDIIESVKRFLNQNCILFHEKEDKRNYTKGKMKTIIVPKSDIYNLYKIVEEKLECRRQEFQQLVGTPETVRNPTVDLDWLIGIYEAEGSFCLNEKNNNRLGIVIDIVNTNELIITKAAINLQVLGCAWYSKKFTPEINKPYIRLTISGMKRCFRFLRKTKGLWKSNRNIKRTEALLKFIESRFSKAKNTPYTSEEYQLHNQMKQLNYS